MAIRDSLYGGRGLVFLERGGAPSSIKESWPGCFSAFPFISVKGLLFLQGATFLKTENAEIGKMCPKESWVEALLNFP